MFLADQPNIHPGCISSTGRNGRQSAIPILTTGIQSNITGLSTAPLSGINLTNSNIVSNILLPQTSTQNQAAQQLIGGAISPSLFSTTPLTSNNLGHHQVILNNIQTQMPIQSVCLMKSFFLFTRIDNRIFAAIWTRFVASSMNVLLRRTYITSFYMLKAFLILIVRKILFFLSSSYQCGIYRHPTPRFIYVLVSDNIRQF